MFVALSIQNKAGMTCPSNALEKSSMLTCKLNCQTPGSCYHIKCKEMAGQVYYYVVKYQL